MRPRTGEDLGHELNAGGVSSPHKSRGAGHWLRSSREIRLIGRLQTPPGSDVART
jgi:hypothetical protein